MCDRATIVDMIALGQLVGALIAAGLASIIEIELVATVWFGSEVPDQILGSLEWNIDMIKGSCDNPVFMRKGTLMT